nr:toxic anion resistance protein [uncultured Romboutsia sp.]
MNNKDEFIDINDIDIINQYDKNENMGNMNMNYQNSNMNTANSNMGYQNNSMNMGNMNMNYQNSNMNMANSNMEYQNNSMNMGNMNMNYQNSNMNMANSNMGYQNNSMNMGNMNMNYQNSNMNIAHIDSNRGVVQQEEVSFQNMTAYKQRLRSMKEVQALTSEIEIDNSNSILMFGQQASESISKISDELLNSMKAVKSEEAGEMLVSLTKIMDKFDIKELENVKENSIVSKLFKNLGNSVAKLFQKYDTMGYEVEKVYILLKKYENDIKESNANLKKLYNGNLNYYKELEKYIVAGEMALEEIDVYINQLSNDMSLGEEEKQMMIQKLSISKDMLSQRIYDLQIAENIAIQTAPMIQTTQMANFNLMRKINSSFIITLPIFKQCLAQAIILKRQQIQAKSIKQLDDKTNELIMRNASNTARQSVEIAKLSSGSSIAIETLEKSYETIIKGIEETKAIQENNRIQRNENSAKLERLKYGMKRNIASV